MVCYGISGVVNSYFHYYTIFYRVILDMSIDNMIEFLMLLL